MSNESMANELAASNRKSACIRKLEAANTELSKRLAQAEGLILRGVKVINRPSWQAGETDAEWSLAASQWIGRQKLERELEAKQ